MPHEFEELSLLPHDRLRATQKAIARPIKKLQTHVFVIVSAFLEWFFLWCAAWIAFHAYGKPEDQEGEEAQSKED